MERPSEISCVCAGPPGCKHPHSQEESVEWVTRWKHRDQRRSKRHTVSFSPKVGGHSEGIPISESKVSEVCMLLSSCYNCCCDGVSVQVLVAAVSDAYKMANDFCYRWNLTIHGKVCDYRHVVHDGVMSSM